MKIPQESYSGRRKRLGAWCQLDKEHVFPKEISHSFNYFAVHLIRGTGAKMMILSRAASWPGLVMHIFYLLFKPILPHGRTSKMELGISPLHSSHICSMCNTEQISFYCISLLIVSLIGLLRRSSWSWLVRASRTWDLTLSPGIKLVRISKTESHCIAQTSLKLRNLGWPQSPNPPASAFLVLRLQACTIIPGPTIHTY